MWSVPPRRYGFNPASILAIDTSALAAVAGRAAAMTTLAGAAGGISCLANGFRLHRGWDLCGLCNGVLCGLVAVTACCHVLEPWAALLVGALAGLWFDLLCWLLLKLRIGEEPGRELGIGEYWLWRGVCGRCVRTGRPYPHAGGACAEPLDTASPPHTLRPRGRLHPAFWPV